MKYVLLFLGVIISACNSNQKEKPGTGELSGFKSRIDSLFTQTIDLDAPGAAVLVSYEGEMLIGAGYGMADLADKIPVNSATNMRMASVSKQFTALCILDLEARGLLSIEDTLSQYWSFPVFKNITVKDLLNHTSGLADYESYFMDKGDSSKVLENKDVLAWLSTSPTPSFSPGEGWEYSNTAYLVLALLVEKVSGIEFSAYAKEYVFENANMESTNFRSLAHPIEIDHRAYCYEIDSLNQWKRVDGFFMNGVIGDGAVYTSVNDYFHYDNALRADAFISDNLHDKVFEKTLAPVPEEKGFYEFFNTFHFGGEALYYTNGWFRNEKSAFHTGSWFGTRTFVVHDLQRSLTIAVFLNSNLSEKRNELVNQTYKIADDYLKSGIKK